MVKVMYSIVLVLLVSVVACGNVESKAHAVEIPEVSKPTITAATPVVEPKEEPAISIEKAEATSSKPIVTAEKPPVVTSKQSVAEPAIEQPKVKVAQPTAKEQKAGKQEATSIVTEAKPAKAVISQSEKAIAVPIADKSKVTEAAQEAVTAPKPPQRVAQSRPMHKFFNYLLENYVSTDGSVNYRGIKGEMPRLDNYIGELQRFPPKEDWTRDEQLAYWINAYNAFTIKLILNHYPTTSITNIDGGKPWDTKWIELDGKSLSLNDIENVIIRPQFKEPRIHFAVNCAAKSCPPLANLAYTKDNLESLLELRTSAFINDPAYNDLTGKSAKVSKIFEWYGEDFGDVAQYLNRYMRMKRPPITKVEYQEYDWSLNGK